MNKLDESIKTFNLVFTNTIPREGFCRVGFNVLNTDVNFDNSISLNEMKDTFVETHKNFKKEYDELDKFDLGDNVEVDYFSTCEINNDIYRVMILYIENPKMINKPYTYLYLREMNGKLYPLVTNQNDPYDRERYSEEIELDEEKAKGYLDLFEKYEPLFNFYKMYRIGSIYGDGTFCLFSRINTDFNNFLDDMSSMEFSVGSNFFMSPGDHIKITYNIDKEEIDEEKSYVELDGYRMPANKDIYNKILDEIHLNKDNINKNIINRNKKIDFDSIVELRNNSDNKTKKLIK